MAAAELQGRTLGEKHRNYNELVNKTLKSDTIILKPEDFNASDSDINNLVKIDVAAKKKYIEYVLRILQCEDMLYVSRAIKQSRWLITDRQYSHIINPHYLHTKLFPHMMAKARTKLLLHIRIHLKDEERVDNFYNFFKERDIDAAFSWLPHCSLPLALQEVKKYRVEMNYNINEHLFKRLGEKSFTFLEICIEGHDYPCTKLQSTMKSFLSTNTEKYLNLVESYDTNRTPKFGPKATKIIMKTCPRRILNNFERYSDHIDLPTFAKHLKTREIKEFIFKILENIDMISWLKYDNLKHFIKYLPKEEKFDFVKKFIIEHSKTENDETLQTNTAQTSSVECLDILPLHNSKNLYRWYHFAPFAVAFTDLTKLIRTESTPAERIAMFDILLSSADRDPKHLQTILKFYSDNHINEPFNLKKKFLNTLVKKSETYRFNETMWNTLNNIFHSLNVYSESPNDIQSCIEIIILYRVLHNENVPEVIESKFNFQSMKSIQTKLNDEEKDKVFNFLYTTLEKKIKHKNIETEIELTELITLLEDMHTLLSDWNKTIEEYSWLLEEIKKIIKLSNEHCWKSKISTLYLKNKSWRRALFKESLLLSPSDITCYNALKHDPELLSHNKNVVDELRCKDKVSLRRMLRMLRVYWPQSLAADWTAWYLSRLDNPAGHKAVFCGLCILASQQQINDIAKKYAPNEFKINWTDDDQIILSLRKHFARNMHLSRPLIPLDLILLYAKGDYLQLVLPSLNAVLYNISAAQLRVHISKLLDAPVSLQKHGIRFASSKLEPAELKKVFYEIWEKSKNSSIHAVLFRQTYGLLCRQTKPRMIEDVWEVLGMLIDNLSTDENKTIYETLDLDKINKVPKLVRGIFLMKSLNTLKCLQTHKVNNCQYRIDELMSSMHDLIEQIDPEFVMIILKETANKKFTTAIYEFPELMASFLLCATNVETQSDRFRILFPLLEHAFVLCETDPNGCYYASRNIVNLLKMISKYFQRFVFEKKMIFPTKLFSDIQSELEIRLPVERFYPARTTWKLFTTYVTILEEHKESLPMIPIEVIEAEEEFKQKSDYYYYFNPKAEKRWNEFYLRAIPKFSKLCLEYLREDIKNYFASIPWIFANCLQHAFDYINELVYMECLKSLALLEDKEFIPSFMMILQSIPNYLDEDDSVEKVAELREKIFSNPSTEIKFHYYKTFEE